MTQQSDRDINKADVPNEKVNSFVHKSPVMRIAIFGMSELINTRLSDEALEICLELLELGVHPKALADVVLHTLDMKEKHAAGQH
ncbi:uncharacterized protein LOC117789836 [Drosophila innubila]|uniref:uncharacterized protein LOC117789836 n=1 Tax=Drosophila innubila TaxID=198719 RepID=UPI00148DF9EB|nr:uncharacterized protein LOC117789836 [Drosophila innubila]